MTDIVKNNNKRDEIECVDVSKRIPHPAHYGRGMASFAQDGSDIYYCKGYNQCQVCGSIESPAIFKGEPWCSDTCRKAYERDYNEKNPPVAVQTVREVQLEKVIALLVLQLSKAKKRVILEQGFVANALNNVDILATTSVTFTASGGAVIKQDFHSTGK